MSNTKLLFDYKCVCVCMKCILVLSLFHFLLLLDFDDDRSTHVARFRFVFRSGILFVDFVRICVLQMKWWSSILLLCVSVVFGLLCQSVFENVAVELRCHITWRRRWARWTFVGIRCIQIGGWVGARSPNAYGCIVRCRGQHWWIHRIPWHTIDGVCVTR